MRTRSYITILAAMMIHAVLFGTGVAIVLSIPGLRAYAAYLIPMVVAASLLAAPFIGWTMAPAVRAKVVRREHLRGNDWY